MHRKRLTFDLDAATRRRVRALAHRREMSTASLARALLEHGLNHIDDDAVAARIADAQLPQRDRLSGHPLAVYIETTRLGELCRTAVQRGMPMAAVVRALVGHGLDHHRDTDVAAVIAAEADRARENRSMNGRHGTDVRYGRAVRSATTVRHEMKENVR